MSIKIITLEVEGFKRLQAVTLEPTANGLTVIGGRNDQGKTSVLDAIMYALGGADYRPAITDHINGDGPANIRLELSNNMVVERKGVNASLKVTTSDGLKGTQGTLNRFVERLALDLPRFMQSSPKEKASTLLKIIGVEDQLQKLDMEERKRFDTRRDLKRDLDQATAVSHEMIRHEETPDPVDVAGLMEQLNQGERLYALKDRLEGNMRTYTVEASRFHEQLLDLEKRKTAIEADLQAACKNEDMARKEAEAVELVDLQPIKDQIESAESVNTAIRQNKEYENQKQKVTALQLNHKSLTQAVEDVRAERANLLLSAEMPLEGLTVVAGELEYGGVPWDGMSSSEQLKVGTSIVRKLNPECGFVLIDKLEQMDRGTLTEFGMWALANKLQIIATRVTTNADECSILIEDGTELTDPETDPDFEIREETDES